MPPAALSERRAYWTQQLDLAYDFMEAMVRYPVAESQEPLVSIADAARAAGVEMRFSETLINHRFPRVYYTRRGIVESLCAVAEKASQRGWLLKIEDGYRSPAMQRGQFHNPAHFDLILKKVLWETGSAAPSVELVMKRVSAMIATRCRVGTHVSGSAVDISMVDRKTGADIDRSHPYLEFSERTPMASPFITPEQRRHREEISELMQTHGWIAYPYEYWHFSQGDCYAESLTQSQRPARYGAVEFCPTTGSHHWIDPETAAEWLESPAFFEEQIEAALKRL